MPLGFKLLFVYFGVVAVLFGLVTVLSLGAFLLFLFSGGFFVFHCAILYGIWYRVSFARIGVIAIALFEIVATSFQLATAWFDPPGFMGLARALIAVVVLVYMFGPVARDWFGIDEDLPVEHGIQHPGT